MNLVEIWDDMGEDIRSTDANNYHDIFIISFFFLLPSSEVFFLCLEPGGPRRGSPGMPALGDGFGQSVELLAAGGMA